MDMNLHKFDIYQGTKKLQIVLRATQILDVLIFFQEKVTLSDATSLLPDNLYGLKKYYIQT